MSEHHEVLHGEAKKEAVEKVKTIMSRVLRISPSDITGEKLIREDLGMDSMQAIESLAVLEKELGIIIDPDKAFEVATVDELFQLVESSLSRATQAACMKR